MPCSTGLDPASEALCVCVCVADHQSTEPCGVCSSLKRSLKESSSISPRYSGHLCQGQSYECFCVLFIQSKGCDLTAKVTLLGSLTANLDGEKRRLKLAEKSDRKRESVVKK